MKTPNELIALEESHTELLAALRGLLKAACPLLEAGKDIPGDLSPEVMEAIAAIQKAEALTISTDLF